MSANPQQVAQIDQFRAAARENLDSAKASYRQHTDLYGETQAFINLVAALCGEIDPHNAMENEQSDRMLTVVEMLAAAIAEAPE